MPAIKINIGKIFERPNIEFESQNQPVAIAGVPFDAANGRSYYINKPTIISDLRIEGYQFHAVSMLVSERKNVKVTSLAGVDDPVIEIIANDLIEIQMAGIVINEDGFPEQELIDLQAMFRLNRSLKVACDYLRLFDVHQVVLTSARFPDMSGYNNVFAFELTALSDKPIELVIKDGI